MLRCSGLSSASNFALISDSTTPELLGAWEAMVKRVRGPKEGEVNKGRGVLLHDVKGAQSTQKGQGRREIDATHRLRLER